MANATQLYQWDRYAFMWSQARLIIAAVALFMGGYPPLRALIPFSGTYGLISSLLTIAWLISGAAAVYLLYRWYTSKQMIFGSKNQKDTVLFLVSVVSGINLGLVAILNKNIGMSISSNKLVFIAVGLLYFFTAAHLMKRYNTSGQKLFSA